MSPLQYQKIIRLQQARRLLVIEKHEATEVAYSVGYESPHSSRGNTPGKSARRRHAMLAAFGATPIVFEETERESHSRPPHARHSSASA
jgi:AraC-like DNA-binding protein